MDPRILIVAANGRIAHRVAAALSAAGNPPDVLVRDAAKAQQALTDESGRPTYRNLFIGELANDSTMRTALSTATTAFLAVGSGPHQADLERRVIDAAREVSLSHLVKLSAAHAAHDAISSVLRVHAEIEDHLAASKVPHTLVSPTSFMDLALIDATSIRQRGYWYGTAADGVNTLIDSADVVDVVVQTLLTPSKQGGTHVLTGPDTHSWTDVARMMSSIAGHTITYNAVTPDERRTQLADAGLAAWRIDLLLGIDELNRHSIYHTPNDTVLRLTGHPAGSLEAFLHRHRTLLRP